MYLKKNNGQFISFKLNMKGTDYNLIQIMLDKTDQAIGYKNKDNHT
jgi:hypothetical protein